MIPSKVMAKLATLGLSEEQAEAVAGMLCEVEEATAAQAEAVVEKSRAKTRERMARWRENHKSDVTERNRASQPVTKPLTGGDARVEDKTSNLVIEPQKKVSKEARASRLPENWTLPVEWRADALAAKLPEHLIDLEASKMRDWSQSAPKGAKTNWRPAWRNWCREAAARVSPQARHGPAPAVAPSQAEVFAIIARNPTNAIEPGPSEDRGSFRQAIPHLSAVRTG